MTTPEGKIKDKVKAYLDSIGAYYFMPVQMGYGKRTLDFLCCVRGHFVAIETKRPGKAMAPFQSRIQEEISNAGGVAIRIRDQLELEWFKDYASRHLT